MRGPRVSRYMMSNDAPSLLKQDTWLEAESMCYPSGSIRAGRRARALCDDGKLRVFRVGIPDTFFSIPAEGKIKGKHVTGFVSIDDEVLKFTQSKSDENVTPQTSS